MMLLLPVMFLRSLATDGLIIAASSALVALTPLPVVRAGGRPMPKCRVRSRPNRDSVAGRHLV